MILSLLTVAALAAVDPCAPVTPAASPDPAAAEAYRAVAAEEGKAGRRETEVAAWRAAAAQDPSDRTAREALGALCRGGGAKQAARDALPEAIRLFDADRYREAAELLHGARHTPPDAEAALLEGISRYELGEDAEAARLLREAELDPSHRAMAQLYLGLVALREGSAREAAALLTDATANSGIASYATELARAARWDGPWLVSAEAGGGYDSNVTLTTSRFGRTNRADAFASLSGLALARPFGANGLYLRAAGAIQKYSTLSGYDLGAVEGAAGARWWQGGTGITGEYAYGSRTLGGAAYLTSNQLLATGAWSSGPFTLSATWAGRWESYAAAWSAFSGFAQRADGRASLALGPSARLGLGWAVSRDATDVSVLAWTEQGPRADLRLLLAPGARLLVEAGGGVRTYDQVDPTARVRQQDVIVEGGAALEKDLGSRVTLRLGLQARSSQSNVVGFDYFKVVPTVSIGGMMSP